MAKDFATPFHDRPDTELLDQKKTLPKASLEMLSKISSISSDRTLSCNLTLTQGRALDLVPTVAKNYTLWSEKVHGGNRIFGGRGRSDKKQTWVPSQENATIEFDFNMPVGVSTLCVLMYGANGMWLEASFPEVMKEMVEVTEDDGEEDCQQMNANGTVIPCHRAELDEGDNEDDGDDGEDLDFPLSDDDDMPPSSSSSSSSSRRRRRRSNDSSNSLSQLKKRGRLERPKMRTRETTCHYRGGVEWTIYSVYKIDCGCSIPKALADGESHTIKFRATTGLVQIAGVVLW